MDCDSPLNHAKYIQKTHSGGDGEVDDVDLDAHFRQVVRVGKLGGHVEPEVGIVLNVNVPKPDQCTGACKDQGSTGNTARRGESERKRTLPGLFACSNVLRLYVHNDCPSFTSSTNRC